MTEQLEAHGPYVAFISFVLVLVALATIEAIREAHTKRSRR